MSLRAGVLIVGSLVWDQSQIRQDWREASLRLDARQRVTAPISYGRLSPARDHTYTMVFSANQIRDGVGTGVALAVPFKKTIESTASLISEARELWRAESKSSTTYGTDVSATWGSVGLLLNPACADIDDLLPAWETAVSESPDYGALPIADSEQPILDDRTGLALFPWPRLADSTESLPLDALLFTPTHATIEYGRYPSPDVVAEAWRSNPERAEYFWNNLKWGIETSKDSEIRTELEFLR